MIDLPLYLNVTYPDDPWGFYGVLAAVAQAVLSAAAVLWSIHVARADGKRRDKEAADAHAARLMGLYRISLITADWCQKAADHAQGGQGTFIHARWGARLQECLRTLEDYSTAELPSQKMASRLMRARAELAVAVSAYAKADKDRGYFKNDAFVAACIDAATQLTELRNEAETRAHKSN